MNDFAYTDIPLVGEVDADTGKLNLYAMVHGVPVVVSSHKAGHFVPRIEANKAKAQSEAESSGSGQ